MVTLSVYDPLEDYLDVEHIHGYVEVPLRCLASHVAEELELNEEEMTLAMQRTFDVCCHMRINIREHFRQVYISDNECMRTDWLMSDLGSYLLLINGSTANPHVARAQIYFLMQRTKQ
jgi:hypothetical protein